MKNKKRKENLLSVLSCRDFDTVRIFSSEFFCMIQSNLI